MDFRIIKRRMSGFEFSIMRIWFDDISRSEYVYVVQERFCRFLWKDLKINTKRYANHVPTLYRSVTAAEKDLEIYAKHKVLGWNSKVVHSYSYDTDKVDNLLAKLRDNV